MVQAATAPTPGDGPMTWKAICSCYPDEWVVVVDMERADHNFELGSARVVAHDPRRAVALAAARSVIAGPQHSGSFFTGRRRGPTSGLGWL